MKGILGTMDGFLVQSEINREILFKEFKKEILKGADPNSIQDDIYARTNIYPGEDLTTSDKYYLKKCVENYYRTVNGR